MLKFDLENNNNKKINNLKIKIKNKNIPY